MTEQTFPESPRNFLFKVSMSLSHYHSHIQPLEKHPCLFWEHTDTKKGHGLATSSPRCGVAGDQLTGVTTKPGRAHVGVLWILDVQKKWNFLLCSSEWQEAQGTCPGHSVLPAGMDIGQGTNSRSDSGESCAPASLAIQNPAFNRQQSM